MISFKYILVKLLLFYFVQPSVLASSKHVFPKPLNRSSKSLSVNWSPSEISMPQAQSRDYQIGHTPRNGISEERQPNSESFNYTNLNSFNAPVSRVDSQSGWNNEAQSYMPYAHDTQVDSYFPQNYHSHNGWGHTPAYGHGSHGGESAEFELENKLFTKTVAATKALKVGKLIFTVCMVLVVLVLAGLGKLGVTLSPAALPLALLPIGFIALILFVPLFLLYIPIVATGHAGGERRRRRSILEDDYILTSEITKFEEALYKIKRNIYSMLEEPPWENEEGA